MRSACSPPSASCPRATTTRSSPAGRSSRKRCAAGSAGASFHERELAGEAEHAHGRRVVAGGAAGGEGAGDALVLAAADQRERQRDRRGAARAGGHGGRGEAG